MLSQPLLELAFFMPTKKKFLKYFELGRVDLCGMKNKQHEDKV